jgi:hypothetical protein
VKKNEVKYRYIGDKNTDPSIKKHECSAVRRADGKCIRGKNGSMLVQFEEGSLHVVVGRLLRKIEN